MNIWIAFAILAAFFICYEILQWRKECRRMLLCQGRTISAACGHKAHLENIIKVGDERYWLTLKPGPDGRIPYCHKCLASMAFPCAVCGKTIFVGNPVSLSNHVRLAEKKPFKEIDFGGASQFVCCCRPECAGQNRPAVGYWMVPGAVLFFPSGPASIKAEDMVRHNHGASSKIAISNN